MTSVWGELNRRNVVRVAIAYAIVGWLIVQVVDTVFAQFGFPAWTFQFVTILLVIGFPLSLIFAWAYELTPEGLKKETDVDRSQSITVTTARKLDFIIISVLAVALVFFAFDKFVWTEAIEPVVTANDSQNSLTEAMATIEDLNSRLAASEDRYRELQRVHHEVLQGLAAPEQVYPPDGSHMIGNSVALEWTYGDDSQKDDFTLQIVPVNAGEPATRRGINKREMKYYYDIPVGDYGSFIWRLRKGDLNSEHEWSEWRRFTAYASAVDRLRSRKELVVGTVPAYKGPFSYLENEDIVGFDIELVRWIASQLGEQLVIPDLKVRIVNYNWDQLLPAVEDQLFDLAVASLSKSKDRTQRFKRLRFSDGYIDIKQVLLSLDEKILPRDLKNSVVGVAFDTTNELAAMSLAESFGITVDAQSEYYPELKDKLLSGEIDFALVDDLLAFTAQGRGFYQHEISDLLEKSGYFERMFDGSNEQYAIAVVYEPQVEDTLLSRVNGILRSPAGQRKLEELKARLADGAWQ